MSIFSGILLGLLVLSAQAQNTPAIPLQADPATPVIVLDWRDGFREPRVNKNPYLTVYANGKTVVVDPAGRDRDIEVRLSASELQELLRFITVDQSFFQFSAADVQKQIEVEDERRGVRFFLADASTAFIRVTTADREIENSFNGASYFAREYPMVKPLAQFAEVEKRLRSLHDDIKAGRR